MPSRYAASPLRTRVARRPRDPATPRAPTAARRRAGWGLLLPCCPLYGFALVPIPPARMADAASREESAADCDPQLLQKPQAAHRRGGFRQGATAACPAVPVQCPQPLPRVVDFQTRVLVLSDVRSQVKPKSR